MKKLGLPACVLIVGTAALFLLFLLLPKSDYSATEKRYLADAPEITPDALLEGSFGEAAEDYVADHFPGRNLFVGADAYFRLLTGRNAASDVYHCKDGYLIFAPKPYDTETLTKNVDRFDAFAADYDIPATLIVVPSTGYVMDGVLPEVHAAYHDDEAMDLIESRCGSLNVLDLRDLFAETSDETQLYYKTDHHLTSAGCYTVYQAYRQSLGLSAQSRDAYTVAAYGGFHGTAWSGSGYFLTPADDVELWDAGLNATVTIQDAGEDDIVSDSLYFTDQLDADDMYTVFLDGNHSLVRIENPDADGGRLLIVKDSFAHCLATFLAADYSEIILVDLRYYRYPVSQLMEENDITELLFVYGMDSLLTDTNSAWLD